MELNMKREDKILKEFSSIYKKGIRKEYDIGDINPLDILANDCQNPADYFITALNPLKDIHIGQPFNLILTNKKDKYFKKGWDSIEDIKEYFFFGKQDEIFLILNLKNNSILSLMAGDFEPEPIARSFEDFILFFIEILKISDPFLTANDSDEDYFLLEDENFLKCVENFISQTSLNIDKYNIFETFFS